MSIVLSNTVPRLFLYLVVVRSETKTLSSTFFDHHDRPRPPGETRGNWESPQVRMKGFCWKMINPTEEDVLDVYVAILSCHIQKSGVYGYEYFYFTHEEMDRLLDGTDPLT